MSVPKKHHTSSARDQRRSHHALKKTTLVQCPKCKQTIAPHRVCKYCGYYNGEEIIKIKTTLDKKKAKKEKEAKKEAKQ
ncbi:MAG: 50S ribosomal protein L32 [Patescibacteria group bacterium]|nr:50S ribosomal protein L32 [Patescibacteria group bacterium]MDD4303935.1 50S ribosomal protein L32 [Patescibacteria group bacterium]MDD4695077.1 50S ribosomal protein L32 [Patescibacteria group bacterium]